MRKQDNLTGLIQSLSASEKKYFTQFISMRRDNKKYAVLFNALQKQDKYDADLLCRVLKRTKKQITDEKNYLQQVLLKALENYHSQSKPQISVHNYIIQAEIAFDKLQYDMGFDLLGKADAICTKMEDFPMLIKIGEIKRRMYWDTRDVTKCLQTGPLIKSHIERVSTIADYTDIRMKILTETMYTKVLDSANKGKYYEEHPLLKSVDKATSATEKLLFYHTWISYHIWFGEKKRAFDVAKECYGLLSDFPEQFSANHQLRYSLLTKCHAAFEMSTDFSEEGDRALQDWSNPLLIGSGFYKLV